MLGALCVRRLLPYGVQLKTINMLEYATCHTDVQVEGHTLRRDSYIVSFFVLLILSLSIHFFFFFSFPYSFLFHLSNYVFSKNPSSFFLPCSFFFFPSSFIFYLLILFHSFARSTFTNFADFRSKSFVSSPKPSVPAMLSVVFRM